MLLSLKQEAVIYKMIIYRKKQREGDKSMTKVSFAKKLHTEQCSIKLYTTKEETISTKIEKTVLYYQHRYTLFVMEYWSSI